jgi:hypothetical protein
LESLSARSPVAQSVERLTVNQDVAGSSPARGANFFNRLATSILLEENRADVTLTEFPSFFAKLSKNRRSAAADPYLGRRR